MKKLKTNTVKTERTSDATWRALVSRIHKSILTILVVLFASLCINAQTVSGVISDTDGSPLIGANVLVKGTDTGTISELDGSYSVQVNDLNGILVFSYVGYENIEVEIGGRTSVDVIMQISGLLDEVIVIGYGSVKKSDLTGSVSSLKSKDFNSGLGFQTSI